jgi:hypothetical protein
MRTDGRWPTSVTHECRRCDELIGLKSAFVDGFVVGNTQNLMRDLGPKS